MTRRFHFNVVFERCFIYRMENLTFRLLTSSDYFKSIVRFLRIFSNDSNGSERRGINDYCINYFIGARSRISVVGVTRIRLFTRDSNTGLLYQCTIKRGRPRNVRVLFIRLLRSRFASALFRRGNGTVST